MKTRIVRTALLATLAVASVTAALAQAKPREINACSLLNETEISAIIGVPVGPGERKDTGFSTANFYSSTCLWRVKGDEGANNPGLPLGGARFAILLVQSYPKGEVGTFLDSFREAARHGDISGQPLLLKIGDEAMWWGDGVAARKGEVSFGISVRIPQEDAKHRGRAEALARQIVGRL